MRRWTFVGGATVLALCALTAAPSFAAQDTGKNCRMEQQCHWQDFKKICVWVKVCR